MGCTEMDTGDTAAVETADLVVGMADLAVAGMVVVDLPVVGMADL